MPTDEENQATSKLYSTLFQSYEERLRTDLRHGPYSGIDAPGDLWQLQKTVTLTIQTNTPQFVRDALKASISRLEALCQTARTQVEQTPDGDAWLEMWQ